MTDVEPLVRTQLERLMPLPEGSRREWADVLARSRHRHRRYRRWVRASVAVAVLVLIALALLVAAPALGFRAVSNVFGQEPSPSWTWPEGLPGDPIQPPKIVRSANETANGRFGDRVDLENVRQIVSAGGKGERSRDALLAAGGLNGDVCLAKLLADGTAFSPFRCLNDAAPPGAPALARQAVFVSESEGGHRGSVVDYATLTGVVRSDVGRVVLDLQDGETIELPLNRWRGFGYSTTDSARFPKTLSVYRTWDFLFRHHQKLVGSVPLQRVEHLAPTPLCGETAGPCPPGVKP